jgi:hypothetical protein
MGILIEFNPSAFKHGVSAENICYVLNHPCYEGMLNGCDDKYIVLGFDIANNLLEILYNYNEIEENRVNVFHAMKCRSIYFPLLYE